MIVNNQPTGTFSCTPNYVAPGGSIICVVNVPTTRPVGSLVIGNLYLSAANCGLTSNGICQGAPTQIYSGTFTAHVQPESVPQVFTIIIKAANTTQYTSGKDKLTVIVQFAGFPLGGATVNFTVNNNAYGVVPTVATTNSSGVAVSYISGATPGSVTVTAYYGSLNVSNVTTIQFITPPTTTLLTTISTTSSTSTTTSTTTTSTTTTIQLYAVVNTIIVGFLPGSIAITPDGKYLYVGNVGSGTVSVINTVTNTVVNTIVVGPPINGMIGTTADIAITPNGAYAYVADLSANTVSKIDTATNMVTNVISVTSALGVAVTPNGANVFVTQSSLDTVSVINTVTNSIIRVYAVDKTPVEVGITPNGAYAYVSDYGSGPSKVTALNLVAGGSTNINVVGTSPAGLAITPNGAFVYVTTGGSDAVTVIDTSTNNVNTIIPVGVGPRNIAIAPTGNRAYVVDSVGKKLDVIDTATNIVTNTIGLGGNPSDIVLSPNGDYAYVTQNFPDAVLVIKIA